MIDTQYKIIEIFTDGSAAPNPGPGGFGVVAVETIFNKEHHIPIHKEIIYTHSCACKDTTTNNREELKAMIDALYYVNKEIKKQCLYDNIFAVIIYSDSSYVVNTCTKWINGWRKNFWRNSKNVEVQNIDLLQDLYHGLHTYRTQFEDVPKEFRPFVYEISLVKGHDKIAGNEYADALATKNRAKMEEWYDKVIVF